jgi:yecA family protein
MRNLAPESLRADELERLQNALVGQMEAAGCMPLDVAHGFLTATAGMGGDGSESAQLDRVLGALAADLSLRALLGRFRMQLLSDLQLDDFGPLILHMPRDDGTTLPLPYGWCRGYVAGVEFLGEGERDRMIGDERAGSLLAPILSFLMYEESQWFEPPDEAAHRETVDELGAAALALYRWRRQRLHS